MTNYKQKIKAVILKEHETGRIIDIKLYSLDGTEYYGLVSVHGNDVTFDNETDYETRMIVSSRLMITAIIRAAVVEFIYSDY